METRVNKRVLIISIIALAFVYVINICASYIYLRSFCISAAMDDYLKHNTIIFYKNKLIFWMHVTHRWRVGAS